jgi:hypothetical protein
MYNRPIKLPTRVTPFWGVVLFLLSVPICYFIVKLAVAGIDSGEITTPSKHGQGVLVYRTVHPVIFWCLVILYSGFGFTYFGLMFSVLWKAFRESNK